jgi:hypothetical protein
MQVDEARRDDAAAQMLDGDAFIVAREPRIRPHGPHHLPPAGVGANDQQAVFFIPRRTVVGKSQDCASVTSHSASAEPPQGG